MSGEEELSQKFVMQLALCIAYYSFRLMAGLLVFYSKCSLVNISCVRALWEKAMLSVKGSQTKNLDTVTVFNYNMC